MVLEKEYPQNGPLDEGVQEFIEQKDGPNIEDLLYDDLDQTFEGIKRLMYECVARSIDDIKKYVPYHPGQMRQKNDSKVAKLHYTLAVLWITRENDSRLFGFESCCENLNIHPSRVRQKIAPYLNKE